MKNPNLIAKVALCMTDGVKWIIWSPGPDGKYDLDPKKDWDPKIDQPSEQLMLKRYDPTNGMQNSAGDIFRVSSP